MATLGTTIQLQVNMNMPLLLALWNTIYSFLLRW
jgi:hypothetical protein